MMVMRGDSAAVVFFLSRMGTVPFPKQNAATQRDDAEDDGDHRFDAGVDSMMQGCFHIFACLVFLKGIGHRLCRIVRMLDREQAFHERRQPSGWRGFWKDGDDFIVNGCR